MSKKISISDKDLQLLKLQVANDLMKKEIKQKDAKLKRLVIDLAKLQIQLDIANRKYESLMKNPELLKAEAEELLRNLRATNEALEKQLIEECATNEALEKQLIEKRATNEALEKQLIKKNRELEAKKKIEIEKEILKQELEKVRQDSLAMKMVTWDGKPINVFDCLIKQTGKSVVLEKELADLKVKYSTLPLPEIVRTEITRSEKRLSAPIRFEVDCVLTEGLSSRAESDEIRRQKWYKILELSPDCRVELIRRIIIFSGLLDDREMKQQHFRNFVLSKPLRENKLKNEEYFKRFIQCVWKHIDHHVDKKNEFFSALFTYLDAVPWTSTFPPNSAKFEKWCRSQYYSFADTVVKVFSDITREIHTAEFFVGDIIPYEYNLFKKHSSDQCINILMCCYTNY